VQDIDIPLSNHIIQLQFELPKNIRHRQVHLGIRQVKADAGARAAAKGEEVFRQALLLRLMLKRLLAIVAKSKGRLIVIIRVEPALGDEPSRLREDRRIVVDEHGGHGDGGVRRDDVVGVRDGAVREGAFHAVRDAVAQTEAFGEDGGEVGEVFELLQGRGHVGVWHGLLELGGESGEHGRVGEDVVGERLQRVLRRDAARADQADGFLAEAVEGAFLRWHFLVE